MQIALDNSASMLYTVKVAQDKAELCKGSTTDSDSVCEGSNPSSAATLPRNRKVSGFFLFSGGFCAILMVTHTV